jgi:Peptidase family M23
MSAPKLQVSVEPFESGAVVYAPMAAPAEGHAEQGRLMLQLAITNQEPSSLELGDLSIDLTGPGSYPSASLAVDWFWTSSGVEQHASVTIGPGSSTLWWFQHASDDLIFPAAPAPTGIELALTCAGFSAPATFAFGLAPHVAPTPTGVYLFPASTADLVQEYWETNGASHGIGAEGSQSFAYDLGVWGLDSGTWSWLHPGTTGTKNTDFRIWGKPIRAMAEGEVNQVLYDVPTNPKPLTGPDFDSQLAAQKALTWGKWLTDHGYDYDADVPHAGAGNHVYLQHGAEIVLYAHMQPDTIPQAFRTPGAPVQPGDVLGLAGNSGNSTAPHLHVHAIRGTQAEDGPLRPLVFAPFSDLEADLIESQDQPWVEVKDAGRSLPPVDAFVWPDAPAHEHRPGEGEAAIDPLALVLRNDIYVLLTLPDPPPIERLVEELRRELRSASPAVTRRLAQRLEGVRSYVAAAERAARSARR